VRFTGKVSRTGSTFPQPSGITTAVIDPTTGLLATEFCPYVMTEVFREGEAPSQLCDRHSSYFDAQFAEATEGYGEEKAVMDAAGEAGDQAATAASTADDRGERKRHPIRRWFKKVFGGNSSPGRDERGPGEKDEKKEDDPNRPPG
ncbi:MAG: hypothetical protein ABUT39_28805, partial [Acidobacteriota bacterium]